MIKDGPLDRIAPGVKITAQMSPEAIESDFQFVQQMGLHGFQLKKLQNCLLGFLLLLFLQLPF